MFNDRTVRKFRLMLLSVRQWRKRLVFWGGAVAIGIVCSYFALAVDYVSAFFADHISVHRWLPLFVTPFVFVLSAGLTRRFAPAARGSGIPQAIAARVMRDPESRKRLLGIRVVILKILLTLLGLLGGASIGREGPSVQIGAAIMLLFAPAGKLNAQRGAVLAGAAAGVAAAFNTPLAGIVFAIEEMARAFEQRNSAIVLIAIVFAGAASISILGNYNYFGYTQISLSLGQNWAAILCVGILGGVFGSMFARLMLDAEPYLRRKLHVGKGSPLLFAALCGLGVAIIGSVTSGLTYGSGYTLGHDLLHQQLEPVWWQMPAKFIATILSAISGIPGGIFSPSLSIGAALGADISAWFPSTPLQGMVALSMVAYFAAVTQAPITAFVIVLEITGRAADPVPLIAVGVIAAGISRVLCPTSLYHGLARAFLVKDSPVPAQSAE